MRPGQNRNHLRGFVELERVDAGFVAFGKTKFCKSAPEVVQPLGNLLARKPFMLSGFGILGAQESDVRKFGYTMLE